jgi:hypothetical protein
MTEYFLYSKATVTSFGSRTFKANSDDDAVVVCPYLRGA